MSFVLCDIIMVFCNNKLHTYEVYETVVPRASYVTGESCSGILYIMC